ncbi:hypothetical protein M1B34_06080 [Pseudomonas sp. MAFF 302030]|jgi:hypothetical protein|uniref:Multidrug ABC transporter ATPase n=1 Tax=Pseudomonas morbosilactucae TaxID=2938197 RepID=A0A9X1YTI2_9PSED|nr:hypothetical protein [Pseudomonas morbosilactucae]MCK9797321.1 hypothetical protein [Pseudomonas morbosilactucae]
MNLPSPLIASLAVFGLWTSASQAVAECQAPQRTQTLPGYALCKDWPAFPGQTLTVLSELQPDPVLGNASGDGLYDLRLALVDSASGKTLARYQQPSAFMSDAVGFESLTLDTGRYQLAPQVRAFGVRASFKGSSRVNPMDQVSLNLYVREGENLRPVMDKFLAYSYSGEWDGNCAGERTETTRTLDIAKTRSHGYADLIVRSVTLTTTGKGQGEQCQSRSVTAKPVLTTLRYDGQRYVLPQGFQSL